MRGPEGDASTSRATRAFALLIAVQAVHSVEEFVTRLYAVFPPATFVSRLFSEDPRTGFAIGNALLVAAGVWCLLFPIRRGWVAARPLALAWAMLEIGNGLAHLGLAMLERGYFPGMATAPLLVLAGGWLLLKAR